MIDNPYIQYSIYIIFGLIILILVAIKAYSIFRNKKGLKFSKEFNNNEKHKNGEGSVTLINENSNVRPPEQVQIDFSAKTISLILKSKINTTPMYEMLKAKLNSAGLYEKEHTSEDGYFFTSKHDEGDNKFYVLNLKSPGTFLENQEIEAINLTLEMPNSIKKKTEGLTVFNEMIDLANSIKSNFDMGLFDEDLNKVDAQTLEYLREEVSQTDMGYGT